MISPEGGVDIEKLRAQFRTYLAMASDAIVNQSSEERVSGSETISLPKRNLEKARQYTEEYFLRMSSLDTVHCHIPGDEVYHLQVHFFRITNKV